MSDIRLVALDLDDTLLRSDLSISKANLEALSSARAKGVRVVLASGRNIHSMLPFSKAIGQEGPEDLMICTNGAEILRVPSGEAIYENRIPPALCREVIEWLDGHGAAWQVYRDGKILTSARNYWSDMDTRLTGQPCELVSDRESVIAAGQLKFLAPADPEEVQRTMAGLKEAFGPRLAVFTSKPYFLEILEPRSDKGTALERLAGILGLGREAVMAVGDAHNDLGMIAWAGWGCAPANALPEVRALARIVAPLGHEEDAVAWLFRETGVI